MIFSDLAKEGWQNKVSYVGNKGSAFAITKSSIL